MSHKPFLGLVRHIRCAEETDEVGADEPYVIVVAADLKKAPPQVEATRYGPWGNVDKGEAHATVVLPSSTPSAIRASLDSMGLTRRPFWGIGGAPVKIAHEDDVVFLFAVVEHDDGDPEAARGLAKLAVTGSLAASMGLDRNTRVSKAIADMASSLKVPTGAPNFEDLLGVKELRLTPSDLTAGNHALAVNINGDGGKYGIRIDLNSQ